MADAPTLPRPRHAPDVAAFFRRYAALTGLIVLLAFNMAVTPHFLSLQTLNVNLTQVATIVIVSAQSSCRSFLESSNKTDLLLPVAKEAL